MLKRKKKIIAKVMATTMLATTLATTLPISASALEPRSAAVSSNILAGDDRYETAVRVSENGWSSATNAVIINGDKGLVDALTATPYASLKDAPILITQKDKLTATTKARLTKLGVKNVSIVGGEAVVSKGVENELKAMGIAVTRIKGDDRYLTAVAVANEMHKISSVSKVAVVNGATGLPDAVSIAAPAADNKMPILLSDPKNGINASKAFMNGKSIYRSYVVGQTDSVSDSVMNSLPGTKTRLGGDDRHDTNAKVIREFYTQKELDNIYVAKSGYVKNNEELVDALAVGVLAAKNDDPVVIVGKSLANSQNTLLREKSFTKITQVGDGIPAASIEGIKDTQKDPEARVTGVTLVNYKTIKLSGSELNRISSSNIYMSGNYVTNYESNTSGSEATVTFNNAFNNGTNTVNVKSNLGTSTNHTFTYGAAISTVEAVTSEIGTSGIQYLEFTVNNGQKRTIEEMKALGYTVEFRSTQDIFYTSASASSKTSSTGKLRTNIPASTATPFTKDDTFNYEVVLKKDNQTMTSSLRAVKVVDKSTNYKEVRSFDFELSNGVKLASNKMVVNESSTIKDIKVVNNNNAIQDLAVANTTVTSSNSSVIKVNNAAGDDKNKLTAMSNGTAEITVTAGSVSRKIALTVVSDARDWSRIELASSGANVTTGATVGTNVIVKDQYGDPVLGHTLTPEDKNVKAEYSTANIIATVSPAIASTDKEGKTTINLQANSNTGYGNLIFKKGTSTLATLRVNVVANTGANTWKLETSAKDTKLDMYTPVGKDVDNTLDLKLNGYMNSTYFVSTETAISKHTTGTIPSEGIVLTTSDDKIADINVSSGDIKVTTGTKTGNAVIRAYRNGREVSSVNVTVENSTPKLTSIKTNKIDTIKTAGEYDVVSNLLDLTEVAKDKFIASGLTISGTAEEVVLSTSGSQPLLYVDYNNNGKYEPNTTDLLIANIDVSTDFGAAVANNGKVTLANGNKGNIIVRIIPNGSVNPLKVEVINVDVVK